MAASPHAEEPESAGPDEAPVPRAPRVPRLVSISGSGVVRPNLFVNPLSDATFAQRTTEFVRHGASRPEDLADQLRPAYPDVVARKREIEGEAESWYVYRDGHWVDEDAGS
jgi:hypothetical protein